MSLTLSKHLGQKKRGESRANTVQRDEKVSRERRGDSSRGKVASHGTRLFTGGLGRDSTVSGVT